MEGDTSMNKPTLIKSLRKARVQNYWYRQSLIKYFFVLFLLGFSYRIVAIHQLDIGGMTVQEKASKQAFYQTTSVKARRGDILDRHGDVLASNLILKKVNLDPTLIQEEYIPLLAKALMMPEANLRESIEKKLSKKAGRRHLIIKKNLRLNDPILANLQKLSTQRVEVCTTKHKEISPSFIDKALIFVKLKQHQKQYTSYQDCRKRKISGVALEQDTRRFYPKSAALAPLIGRIDHSKQGASGIEREFESILSGEDGVDQLSFDKNNQASYFNPTKISTLRHGQDIHLTIDADIQYHAFDAIKKSVEFHDADSGSAIILSPDGEILAMANYPADDPNDKTIYHAANYRNRVLSDKVEPGSTMKPFTMLLALERGKITANDDELIDVSKRIGHIRSDAKAKKYGDAITVKKILQKSHNLGTVNVSERLEKEDMYQTWRKLGFGQPTGLIPSIENSGSLKHFDRWALSDKRALSFGHGPMETNLAQLARAYLVFANDGQIPPLKLIKGVNIDNTSTQVFSKKTTDKIAQLLDSVASWEGSGYRARIKGYDVAGKTGTAEMVVDGRYNKKGAKRTFFTGFVPVKNPKYIMAVRLDHPKKCYTYYDPSIRNKCEGSNSAAMVFKDAMSGILNTDQSIQLIANK